MRQSKLIGISVLGALLMVGSFAVAQTKITLWHTWGTGTYRSTAMDEMVAAFERTNPHIKVEVVPNTGKNSEEAKEKFVVAATGGAPPDVIILSGLNTEWADNGLVQPLTSYFARDGIGPSFLFPGVWEAMQYEGEAWGPPVAADVSTFMMAVNREMFAETGLNPDNPPQTIVELEKMNRKLAVSNSDGRITRVGMYPFSAFGEWNAFSQWTARFGASFIKDTSAGHTWAVNTPEVTEVLTWLSDWYRGIGHANYQRSAVFATRNNPSAQLALGSAAMAMWTNGWNASMDRILKDRSLTAFDYEVTWLPHHPRIKRTDGIEMKGGFALSIPAGASHSDEAWAFIRFWVTSDEAAMIWGNATGDITVKRRNPYAVVMAQDRKKYGTFVEYIQNASPPQPAMPAAARLSAMVSAQVPKVYQGEITPQAALAEIQKQMDIEMQKYR